MIKIQLYAMKRIRIYFTIILFIISNKIIAQEGYFIPNALITPVHISKNEAHLSIGLARGVDFNASYTISNNVALFGTALYNIGTYTHTTLFGDKKNAEKNDYAVSGGLIYLLKSNSNFKYEVSLGLGKYKADNFSYFPGLSGMQTNAEYWSCFSQFNAIKDKNKSQFGYAGRLSYINYNNFNFYDSNNSDLIHRYENIWHLNIEPVLVYSLKFKEIKINLQGGLSIPLKSNFLIEYMTNTNTNEDRLVDNYTQTPSGSGNFIGRIAIQHNFVLIKKK